MELSYKPSNETVPPCDNIIEWTLRRFPCLLSVLMLMLSTQPPSATASNISSSSACSFPEVLYHSINFTHEIQMYLIIRSPPRSLSGDETCTHILSLLYGPMFNVMWGTKRPGNPGKSDLKTKHNRQNEVVFKISPQIFPSQMPLFSVEYLNLWLLFTDPGDRESLPHGGSEEPDHEGSPGR